MNRKGHGEVPSLRVVGCSEHAGGPSVHAARGGTRADPTTRDADWTLLMVQAQAGNASAYSRLLHGVTPYLRSLAARRHRNTHDIEDAVQDVLLTIHAVRHTYDPARPFGPWLVAIANRRLVDRLRRQGRQHAHEVPFEPEHETIAEPLANVETIVERNSLQGAIDRLPPMQRQAIRLLKLRDMSLKDAATATGSSVPALKVATHRAIVSLRRMLADRGDGHPK